MRIIKIFFIFEVVAFSIFTVLRILFTYSIFDFVNGYYPATRDLIAGRGLYDNPSLDINYPPTAFLFLLPIAFIPPDPGQKIWTALSFASIIVAIILLLKSINSLSWKNFLMIYCFAMLSFPVKFTLGMGQINLFILLLVSASFYFYTTGKFTLSGICLGIASSIKLTPIFLILFYIRKKNHMVVLSTILTIFVSIIIFGAFFSWNLYYQYVFEIFPTIPTIGNSSYYNQALTGFLARLTVPDNIAWIINYLVLITLLSLSFLKTSTMKGITLQDAHGYNRELDEFGLFIASLLIGSGLSWQHHFVLLLIPLFTVFINLKKINKVFKIIYLIIYLLIAINIKNPINLNPLSIITLSHVFIGTALLWISKILQPQQYITNTK